jgi:hypothetical protein
MSAPPSVRSGCRAVLTAALAVVALAATATATAAGARAQTVRATSPASAARSDGGGPPALSSGVLQLPAPPAGEAPERPGPLPPRTPTAVMTRLTNDRTIAAWAHPARQVPIYLYPNPRSRGLGHTNLLTEDGFPEVYELLRERTEPAGTWIEIRIPGRPNGRSGWIAAASLGRIHRTHWRIVVNRSARRLTAYFDGRVVMVAPVGVGKPSSPTPPGHFWIRERFRIADRSNPYWPYALGTSDYSTLTDWPGGGVVGIHGDFGQPELIPGDPSHGCVRMHDADIARLAPRVSLGTPVDIV